MAGLDGKITIERGLRPCVVRELCKVPLETGILKYGLNQYKVGERTIKSLFHCWNQVTGNAIVEYEDGTIHEVEPIQIRFVDNAMSEYVFPEMEEKEKMTGWRPISEYSRDKYDWVLVKAFDVDFGCIPFVAEMRADGEWYAHGIMEDEKIPFKVVYFFDMQQLDDFEDKNNEPR